MPLTNPKLVPFQMISALEFWVVNLDWLPIESIGTCSAALIVGRKATCSVWCNESTGDSHDFQHSTENNSSTKPAS